ncbi:MAG: type III pantothenate kinase [Candidatus Sabulitectum sp.]|nr:type III pantothenate kinase [Candidatus Sabulitectum sp.]
MRRLSVDVGNTKTALALFEKDKLLGQWRIRTQRWTADELRILTEALLRSEGFSPPDDVAFACVVPQVRHTVINMCERWLKITPVDVSCATAGIELGYKYPHEIGPDRLANAVAAIVQGRLPAVVVDFGTATTFDVIDGAGRYLGGAISPGVGTSAGELFKKAERLNPIDLVFPESVVGRTTAHAIRSGVLFSAVGAADHIIDLISAEFDSVPELWATGGWGQALGSRCRHSFRICPELTLLGINEIGRKNGEKGS